MFSTKVLLSLREFSFLAGLSLRTTTASGEVSSIRVGRRRLIPKSALLRFVELSHSTHSVPRRKVGR